MRSATKLSNPRFWLKGCGCLTFASFAALVLTLFLFGKHLNARGVWERCTNRAPPEVVSLAFGSGQVFAGTADAGVFRSLDGGLAWEPFSRDLTSPEILSLYLEPRSQSLIASTPRGLLRTSVGGSLWEPLGRNRLTRSGELSVTGVPAGQDPVSGYLIAAGEKELFRSVDGGDHWARLALPAESGRLVLMGEKAGVEILLFGPESLWRSSDGGLGWTREPRPPFDAVDDFCALAHRASDLVVSTYNSGLYLSRDGGRQWSELEGPHTTLSHLTIAGGGRDLFLIALAPRRHEDGPYYEQVYRWPLSDPSGRQTAGTIEGFARVLTVDPRRPGLLYAGTTSGVAVSADLGETWSRRNEGLEDTFAIQDMARLGERIYVLTDHVTTLSSDDGGRTWDLADRHPDNIAESLVVRPSEPCQMLRAHFSRLYRSTDCGATWTLHEGDFKKRLGASGRDSPVVYAIGQGGLRDSLSRSEDFGLTWQKVLEGKALRRAVDPRDEGHVYVSGVELALDGQLVDGIAESRDGGRSWRLLELPFEGAWKVLVMTIGEPPDELLVGTQSGAWLYRPPDGWQVLFERRMLVRDVLRDPGRPGALFLCAEGGVFATDDGGRTWTELGPDAVDCRRLAFVDDGQALLMITPAQAYRYVRHPGWRWVLGMLWRALEG